MKWNFLYQITAASITPDYLATVPRSLSCPQLNLLNPPWTKLLGTPLLLPPDINPIAVNKYISININVDAY